MELNDPVRPEQRLKKDLSDCSGVMKRYIGSYKPGHEITEKMGTSFYYFYGINPDAWHNEELNYDPALEKIFRNAKVLVDLGSGLAVR